MAMCSCCIVLLAPKKKVSAEQKTVYDDVYFQLLLKEIGDEETVFIVGESGRWKKPDPCCPLNFFNSFIPYTLHELLQFYELGRQNLFCRLISLTLPIKFTFATVRIRGSV